MKQYGFGVDIGGTTCKIGLFDMNGTILEKWEIKTNTENHGAAILDDVAAAVLGKLDEKNISKEEVQGDVYKRQVLRTSVHLFQHQWTS